MTRTCGPRSKGFFAPRGPPRQRARPLERGPALAQGFSVAQFLARLRAAGLWRGRKRVSSPATAARDHRSLRALHRAAGGKGRCAIAVLEHCRSHDASAPFVARRRRDRAPRGRVRCPYKQVAPSYRAAHGRTGRWRRPVWVRFWLFAASLLLLWQDPAKALSPTLRLKTLARFAHDTPGIRGLHGVVPAWHPRLSAPRLSSLPSWHLDQLAADYLLAAQLT
jgi:hypothetical protein